MSEDLGHGITLHAGDCLDVLATLESDSFDSCVTDPPYHLVSIVKRFGADNAAEAKSNGATGVYKRASAGFMGKRWDGVEVPKIDAALGNWLAGFADGEGCFVTRKSGKGFVCEFIIHVRADDAPALRAIHHATEIGDIRGPTARADGSSPMIKWVVSRQIDCAKLVQLFRAFPLRAKKSRDFEIWASAVERWIEHEPGTSWGDLASHANLLSAVKAYGASFNGSQLFHYRWAREVFRVLKPGGHIVAFGGTRTYHRLTLAIEDAGFEIRDCLQWLYGTGFPKSKNIGDGWGTALKPACEPIVLARKPLSEKTVAANVLRWGTGAINIDGCRVESGDALVRPAIQRCDNAVLGKGLGAGTQTEPPGRWPANILHDGSPEVVGMFPVHQGHTERINRRNGKHSGVLGAFEGQSVALKQPADCGGSAARFFYTAKADADERLGSKHPTVKPVDLMQWLVRLVTRKGGVVLDPFAGTGTTGEAAFIEGCSACLLEREAEYQGDIRRRVKLLLAGPDEKSHAQIKAKNLPRNDGPLFAKGDES